MHQKDYIQIRPEAPGVRAKDMIPNFVIIGHCGLRKVQVHHAYQGDEISARWHLQPGI